MGAVVKLWRQIDISDILNVMGNLGVNFSKENLEARMKDWDKDHNGTIDFNEVGDLYNTFRIILPIKQWSIVNSIVMIFKAPLPI